MLKPDWCNYNKVISLQLKFKTKLDFPEETAQFLARNFEPFFCERYIIDAKSPESRYKFTWHNTYGIAVRQIKTVSG